MLADGSRGGRGPLGQPARAALGHDALRRPVARGRARPAARGDGPGRRPGLVRRRRRRGHADHAPRGQGPRVRRSVFIAGLEEGRLPHSRALDDERQLEEERRLAYVGITRAQASAVPVPRRHRATWGSGGFTVPSRFLLEIPAELMEGPRPAWPTTSTPRARSTSSWSSGPPLEPLRDPIRAGGGAVPPGQRPARRAAGGDPFAPTRDLAAKRSSYAAGARSGELTTPRRPARSRPGTSRSTSTARRPTTCRSAGSRRRRPASRRGRSCPASAATATATASATPASATGSSYLGKLTRDDEEVTVAFRDARRGTRRCSPAWPTSS